MPIASAKELTPHLERLLEESVGPTIEDQGGHACTARDELDVEHHALWTEARKQHRHKTRERVAFGSESLSTNHRTRLTLLEDQLKQANKDYETLPRMVRTSRETIDPRTTLKNQYTNDNDQLICQICKNEMPFRKLDGEYYFEAVEAFSRKYSSKEHEARFLALCPLCPLCPLCAAMYKEFVKLDDNAMQELQRALMNSDEPEVPLALGEREASLRFVETHWQ